MIAQADPKLTVEPRLAWAHSDPQIPASQVLRLQAYATTSRSQLVAPLLKKQYILKEETRKALGK